MDADEDGFPFLNFQRREDFSFHRELEGKSSVSAVDLLYFYLLVSGGIAVCRRDGRKKVGYQKKGCKEYFFMRERDDIFCLFFMNLLEF